MPKSDKPKTGFFKESTGEPIDDGALERVEEETEQIGVAMYANDPDMEKVTAELVTQEIQINTMNEFGLGLQMKTIRPIAFPQFTTRQQAYRFAAWLINMAEMLPDESLDHTFDEVNEAIRNT